MTNEPSYKQQIKSLALDEEKFVRLTFKSQAHPADGNPWRQVIVRPVLLKNERCWQFSYFTQKQDITKNYRQAEVTARLDELLTLPFTSISAQAIDGELHVQITKKGKPILHRTKSSQPAQAPDLTHDAGKKLILPSGKPDAFLQATGIMDEHGRVYPSMQAKFSQINEFLKLLEHTGELEHFERTPVHILDCGCGSAYLSFAAYHYLNDICQIPAHLVGIDVNEALMRKDNARSRDLGFSHACFAPSTIIDYQPEESPDIVLALHACDTATDEAIVQGIRHNARLILCAPCCHRHLQQQLHAVRPFEGVFRDGILQHRLADILTDTFRALALRILGYKTDVVEFVSPEHTDKNLLIRAVKRPQASRSPAIQEYLDLKQFWAITPYIETLLGAPFTELLHVPA